MEIQNNLSDVVCRVCLTTEEDEKFKTIHALDDVVKIVSVVYGINILKAFENLPAKICNHCEFDIKRAWLIYTRINDAEEYFSVVIPTSLESSSAGASETSLEFFLGNAKENPTSVIFECDSCSKKFKDIDALNLHIKNHDAFFCFFCNNVYPSVDERREHFKAVHKDKAEKLLLIISKSPSDKVSDN